MTTLNALILVLSAFLLSGAVHAETAATRSVAEWIEVARAEAEEQRRSEAATPLDRLLYLGAGKDVSRFGGHGAPPTPPEFTAWWKAHGIAGLERWATEGFPARMDRDHLIYSAMALTAIHHAPKDSATITVHGHAFANTGKRFDAYLARVAATGKDAMRRACSGEPLSRADYEALRLYAPLAYSIWAVPYLPFELGFTGQGSMNWHPSPGQRAPHFALPRLETVLRSPRYTDVYDFDYGRPFRSELVGWLLGVCAGYEAIPVAERREGGPAIRARPYAPDPDGVTLSSARGRPVMIVLNDPIDGYWAATIPNLEPLYQATRDRIDWYFIADSIGDAIYWSDYYLKPSQGYQRIFQKAISLEERAQTAKMMLMRYVNVSIPVLLDDMAQHAQNAYADQGGIAKTILIDRNGIISLNNRLWQQPYDYTHQGQWGHQHLTQAHAVLAANVRKLLDHDDLWDGKPAVIPDWQPPRRVDDVVITGIDAAAGTVTVRTANGKDITTLVDGSTRIVFGDAPNVVKRIGDLAVGATISLTYDGEPAAAVRPAGLIVKGTSLKEVFDGTVQIKPWCPAVATGNDGAVITARLAPRQRADVRGLAFWDEAGAKAQAFRDAWVVATVRDWFDRPDQELRIHVDRATQVIINGMRGRIEDIVPGDRLGVEFRPGERGDVRPYFLFVYRYAVKDAATAPSPSPSP